jgi:hypothetical protein
MTPSGSPSFLQTVFVHARRDIRHGMYHLRHNGALLTFILFLAVGMWFAGAYVHRNPLTMQTMDRRAGCDVEEQLGHRTSTICAK